MPAKKVYETLVTWVDPAGKWHDVGNVGELDPNVVFDIDDLLRIGTIVERPDAAPDRNAPYAAPLPAENKPDQGVGD